MKVNILAGVLALLVVSAIGYRIWQLERPTEATQSVPEPVLVEAEVEAPTVARLLELTNSEREKVGVKSLILDERLNKSAQRKADELKLEGWDDTPHVNDAGVNTAHYIGQEMPECTYGGENIAKDYLQNPIKGFETSEAHWNAILSTRHDYIGYGVNDTYVVVHFCDID